jgi:hypothetical protein
MATISLYNHTARRFMDGSNGAADTYKVMLLNSSASFNATHTTLTQVSNANAYEVYGHGWTQLGETLASVVVSTITTNDAMFDAADVLVNITGGALGPYSAYVIYNDTDADDPPVAYVALTSPVTTADGAVAGMIWASNGIITATVA